MLAPAPLTAQQHLMLRAALLAPVPASAAWARWRRKGSIDLVDAPTFRLLPLLYRNLEGIGLDDPDLPRLKGIYRHAWAANQQLMHRACAALELLHDAGIPTMLLEGTATTVSHYRDVGVRPLEDVDVLVPLVDAERALSTLRTHGWSLRAQIDAARVLRSVHSTPLVDANGTEVDLHWRALPESVCDDDFWAAAVPAELAGVPTLVPGPTEQLMHACAHGLRYAPALLRWTTDAAMIVRDAGAEIDWSRLVEGAASRQIALRVATALALLIELVDSAVPDSAIAALRELPVGSRERLILRFTLEPARVGGYVQLWDLYRRRVDSEGPYPSARDFLQHYADVAQLPSRWSLGPLLVRRVFSLGRAQ